jgi:hypothetical protein
MATKSKQHRSIKRIFIDRITISRRPQSKLVSIKLDVGSLFMDGLNRNCEITLEPPQWIITRALAREINGGYCQ